MSLSRNLISAQTAVARSLCASGCLSRLGSSRNSSLGCPPSGSRLFRSKRGDPLVYAAEDVPSPRELAATRDRDDTPKRPPRPPDAPVLSAHEIDQLARSGNLILDPPYITAYLKRKRSAQPLAVVMPLVEELMSHGFEANAFVIGVLLGRDVWRPKTVLELGSLLRVKPNSINWSQAINNALRMQGQLSALEVYHAALEEGVRPEMSAVNNIVHSLITRTPFYRPDARAIRRAFEIYSSLLEEWGEHEDDSRLEITNLLTALAGTHAVPTRRKDIAYLLDTMKHHGVLYRSNKTLSDAVEGIYRAKSFDAAVDAVWNTPGMRSATYQEHMALLGRIVRLRFKERSSLPFDALMRYLKNITRSGDELEHDAYMIPLGSYAKAGSQLQIEEEVDALGGRDAAHAHLALLRDDLAALERYIRARFDAELADVRTRGALLLAYSCVGRFDTALDLWAGYPRPSADMLSTILVSCRVHKRLDVARAVWAGAAARGIVPDGKAYAAWAECLADNGAWAEAVAALDDRWPADPNATRTAIRILRAVSPDRALRRRMLTAMPEVWRNPVVRENYDVSWGQRRERMVQKLLKDLEVRAPHTANLR